MKTLWFFFLAFGLTGAHAALDVGIMETPSVSLVHQLAFLEDTTGQLSLDDIRKIDVTQGFQINTSPNYALQLGVTRNPWWLRFSLRNETEKTVERFVEIANSRLTRLGFHQIGTAGEVRSIETGSMTPFDSRPYPNRNFVFPVTLTPHSVVTIYIRAESSSSLFIPASIWSPEAFQHHEKIDHLVQGWYVGTGIVMALFNLFLFFALRQRLYFVYVCAVTSITFTVCSGNGLVKELIAADSPVWSLSSASVGYAISVGLLLLFMRQILETSLVLPRADRFLRLLMWLYLLPVPISLAINHQAVIYPIHFLTLSVITFEMLVGVYLCWRRQRSAYFFMLAYSVLITVASINLLAGIGVIPLPWDMGWSMQLASAVEMLLLSFALADRMRQVHRERDHSKYWAAQFQTQLIDELRNSENRLKVMVAQRIDELRRLIDMLSHEIRTPMSVIRMYLSMSQPTIHNHAQAQQAVHDVDSIIERCLEVDQIERDSVTIKQQLLQVDAIVRQFASTHLESERISVSAPQCCEVATDEQILKILLSNLIDNALKYSPPEGRVEIFVSIKKVDYQPGISVLVSNQIGPVGLPDPTQIFKKYYRSSRAHGKSGSGLGLYLVQQFAQLLGGKANYHFDDRQVHFEIWIPAHRASNFSPNPQ